MSTALEHYVRLLDQLLWERAVRELDEDAEESFAMALNDCRRAMTSAEEAQIAEIVARRKAVGARASLGLVDVAPSRTGTSPLRTAA